MTMRKSSTELYESWLGSGFLDQNEAEELRAIAQDAAQIDDRFYTELEFGTAGMRGILGMGTNRMNRYTVRRAAQGLAQYLNDNGGSEAGVVIGYDTRHYSEQFARETAKVMVANGIRAYLFESVHAVPEVSFAIRHFHTASGVMITASHNPKDYNGFKAYGPDGGQLAPEASDVVVAAIESFDMFRDIKIIDDAQLESSPLFQWIGSEVDEEFLNAVQQQSLNPNVVSQVADDFKLVYTPFHGTGLRPVTEILRRIGLKHVIVEPQQAVADPDFSTVKSPNPEDMEGFALATELAKREGATIIVGTDPDADRVGVVVRDSQGKYRTLSGNQTGALLCEYVLSNKKAKGMLTSKSAVLKSIVTTEMVDAIAKNYGVRVENVLTGFKFFAERIARFERENTYHYEFGFEESYGYMPGAYVRDKDAISTTMLIAEMAATYQSRGMTLYDGLMELYEKYGYYLEKTVPLVMSGKDGLEKIAETMRRTRENMPNEFGGIGIAVKQDFLENKQYSADGTVSPLGDYPISNVLKFYMEDGRTFVAIRPSGTEPKVKLYFGTAADNMEDAKSQLNYIVGAVRIHLEL